MREGTEGKTNQLPLSHRRKDGSVRRKASENRNHDVAQCCSLGSNTPGRFRWVFQNKKAVKDREEIMITIKTATSNKRRQGTCKKAAGKNKM
jgi:hypothetical protein